MAALTLSLNTNRNLTILPLAVTMGAGASFSDQGMPVMSKALWHCCCLSLIDEHACLKNAQELQTTIAGLNRRELLQLARWTRKRLDLAVLPLLLLAEASVRHNGEACEAKAEVREAIARLVRTGAEATLLLAYWLRWIGQGSKRRLPNALKKGLSEALALMSDEQLLTGPAAMPIKDLICLVHARPGQPERAALYARLLAGSKTLREPEAVLKGLALREQSEADLENLLAELEGLTLAPLNWLMREREAETEALKTVLRKRLQAALKDLPALSGRSAVLVETGAAVLDRLASAPALQRADLGAMQAALLAQAGECLLGAYASELRWVEARACAGETALALRHAGTGWGKQAWKALDALVRTRVRVERVLILAGAAPDDALLTCWQRYLAQVNDQAMLYWIELSEPGSADALFAAGEHRIVKLKGECRHLPALIGLIEQNLPD